MGKDKILERIDRWSTGYARWVIRWKWAVATAVLLTGLTLASGVFRLTYNDDYRYFFDKDNPQLVAFETVQATFMKNDNAVFVVEPEDGVVFTAKTLAAVHELTEDAWKLPFASRVDSLTNFQNSYAEGDDLVVEDLIESPLSLTREELERKKAVALSEPLVVHRLLSSSAHVAGVIVTLNMPEDDPRGNLKVAIAARALAAKIEAAYPSVDVHIAGNMPMDAAFYELTMRDLKTIVPLMYLGIVILVFVLLRSAAATFSTVMVIGLSSATGLGIAGWLGIPLSGASAAAPTMIITLAVADSIHILVTLFAEMSKGTSKEESIVESLRLNMNPVFLTSLTTAIGFLSINASPVKPLRDLGNITAMGVGAAFIYSILLLPALMAILPVSPRKAGSRGLAWSVRLGDFVIRQRRRLLWGTTALVLAATAFLPKNELTDVWLEYFGESTRIRQDADYINKNLTGGELIEFSLGSGETGGIANPEYLKKIDEFASWYRTQHGVKQTTSLADIIKRLNRNLHGDDPAYYRVPESRELAAQQMLLYEMSLPFGLDLNNTIDVDKSATRMIVSAGGIDTKELRRLVENGENWLRENAPKAMFSYGVGPSVMFAYISHRNIRGTLGGSAIALVLISLILIVALRSVKFGFISLIPNLVPAAAAFGLWGLFVGKVGLGLSIVSGMTLGIVVDDTIHFLAKYLRARRDKDQNPEEAVRFAFQAVAPAMTVTSIILAAGFGILSFSDYAFNGDMGRLTAITIVIALSVDLLMLPPLLLALDKPWGSADSSPAQSQRRSTLVAAAALFLLLPLPTLQAQTREEKGLAIAMEADRRDRGFGDSKVEMKMTLKNKRGQVSKRTLRSRNLEVVGDGDKSLIIFDRPADIKGTALLSFTHKKGPDDQWLYLPALRRVKRIASNNKAGPFMGSEFSYEDFSSHEVEKYTYRHLRDETIGEHDYFVVQLRPVDKKSGYTRQVAWIEKETYREHKVNYYDRKHELLKTLTAKDYKQYLGKYWRAQTMTMINHQTGKSTVIQFKDYKFRTGLTPRDFMRNSLKRAR